MSSFSIARRGSRWSLIPGLDEIKFEGEDELERFLLYAAVDLARAFSSCAARTRAPPAIPLFGGRPSLVQRPPPPLFNVTGPLSERHHGPL